MERPNTNESIIRTFNTAKLYAEGLLFPLMLQFSFFRTQSDFGDKDMKVAQEMSQDIKDILRFNGLKGMCEVTLNLLLSISSTVRLKGNKEEIEHLDEYIKKLEELKENFYERRSDFFTEQYIREEVVEVLERKHFQDMKKIVNILYINTEILMTKNKLLFSDEKNEYLTDQEMLAMLKTEYIEG